MASNSHSIFIIFKCDLSMCIVSRIHRRGRCGRRVILGGRCSLNLWPCAQGSKVGVPLEPVVVFVVASEAVVIVTFKAMLFPFTVVVALTGVVLVNRLRECDRIYVLILAQT